MGFPVGPECAEQVEPTLLFPGMGKHGAAVTMYTKQVWSIWWLRGLGLAVVGSFIIYSQNLKSVAARLMSSKKSFGRQ